MEVPMSLEIYNATDLYNVPDFSKLPTWIIPTEDLLAFFDKKEKNVYPYYKFRTSLHKN
jgi:hypothetical protein